MTILIHNSVKFKFSDKEGRYVIVKGNLENESVTLVNIFVPNSNCLLFFRNLTDRILAEMEGTLVWAGDFNILMNTNLDTTNKKKRNNPISKKFKLLLKNLEL